MAGGALMGLITDGSGLYSQDHILGPFNEDKDVVLKRRVPQIEEIRMLRGADGEDYVNVKDLEKMMWRSKYIPYFTSLSVCMFIKFILKHLKGGAE
jgi:hypothetical protein